MKLNKFICIWLILFIYDIWITTLWSSFSVIQTVNTRILKGLVLWCLTPLSTYFRYTVAVSFIGVRNRSTRRQTLSHNVVSNTPTPWTGFVLTLVVIDTDCIGSSKSNYHTITTTTTPQMYMYRIILFIYDIWITTLWSPFIVTQS